MFDEDEKQAKCRTAIIAVTDRFYIGCRELKGKCGAVAIVFPFKTITFGQQKSEYSDYERSFRISAALSTAIFYYANIENANPFNIAIKLCVKPKTIKLQRYLTFLNTAGPTYVMLNRTPEIISYVSMDSTYKGIDMSNIHMISAMQQSFDSPDSSDSSDSEQIHPASQPVPHPPVAPANQQVAIQNQFAPVMQPDAMQYTFVPAIQAFTQVMQQSFNSLDSSDSEQTLFSQPVAMQNQFAPVLQPAAPANESGTFDSNADFTSECFDTIFDWTNPL